MPDMGNGLKTAIVSPIIGLVVSTFVSASLSSMMPGSGNGLAVMFNLLSIVVGIESLQKAKYWGVMYSLGYFAGIMIIGKYFMESWEYPIYLLVIGFYLFLKITKKIG
jgi:hypothetical protein